METVLKIILGTIAGGLSVGFFLYLLIGPKNFRLRKTRMGDCIDVAGYIEENHKDKPDDEKIAIYTSFDERESTSFEKGI